MISSGENPRRARRGVSKRKSEMWSFPAGKVASDVHRFKYVHRNFSFWGKDCPQAFLKWKRHPGKVLLRPSLRRRLRNEGH